VLGRCAGGARSRHEGALLEPQRVAGSIVSEAPVHLVAPIGVSDGDLSRLVVDFVENPVLLDSKPPRGGAFQALRPGRSRIGFELLQPIMNVFGDPDREGFDLAGDALRQDDPEGRHLSAPGVNPSLELLERDRGFACLLASTLGENLNVFRVAGPLEALRPFVAGAPLRGRVCRGSAHGGHSTPHLAEAS